MFAAHASESTVDAPSVTLRPVPSQHRLPGQAILGIGAEVKAYVAVEIIPGIGTYVPTEQSAYVVAVEDIPDGVYEIWQPCEEHQTTHRVYAQYEGDVHHEAGKPDLPILLVLAPVLDDEGNQF